MTAGDPAVAWVIVAHPDDELLYAGAAILSNPKRVWNLVIATHVAASRRGREALAVGEALRANSIENRYHFLEHPDQKDEADGGIDARRFCAQIAALPVGTSDFVYTHGENGEYGHRAHKGVHRLVLETLPGNPVRTFALRSATETYADQLILKEKRRIFRECYPSQSGVWDRLRGQTDRLMFVNESHVRVERTLVPRSCA
jgi:LmbE family N-acetylglucosaminyl deacetylase